MKRRPPLRVLLVLAACGLACCAAGCTWKGRLIGSRSLPAEREPSRRAGAGTVAPRAVVLVAAVAPPDRGE